MTAQLKKELIDAVIVSTEFYKKERSAYIFFKKQKNKFALGFVYHPAGFGTFLVPASKIKKTTREKPWPIFKLENSKVTDIQQVESDRLFKIFLKSDNKNHILLIESIGPNGNIWLLDEDFKKLSTLRKKEYAPGEKYDFGRNIKRLNPFLISEKELGELFSANEQNIVSLLEKNISGFNRSLAIESLKRAGIENRD
ncbi:NFACT family protein, partial [candidate division KSB1 bacterium]|nr:NFACT family protein [candidate division KSB1 bacterium]